VSDYTPSVEDMRGHYEDTWFGAPHTNSKQEKDEEFDRFIALVKADERARIIALLEQHTGYGDDEQDEYFLSAIALIKGDNK
jgi:hypothetical protein